MYRSDKDLQWWRPCYSVIGLSCVTQLFPNIHLTDFSSVFGWIWLCTGVRRNMSCKKRWCESWVKFRFLDLQVHSCVGNFLCTNTDIFSFNPTCIFLNVENTWCVESSVQSSARPHLMWVDLFLFRFRFICPFFLPLTSNQLQEKNRRNYLNKTSEHLTSRYGQNATRLCNNDMFFVHLLSSAIAHMQ